MRVKKHIITTHRLKRLRRGRAHGERYSNNDSCDYVMISRVIENNPIKEVFKVANKCFKEETI